ncbi:MAG: dihydrolipoyl dehydrogenase [Sedimentisphaerales bacterium]|nr:dihydrolipoyl dehydrogenase [Sedimentisphaerales bacterium]
MAEKVRVAIIGAGSAGLSALRQVQSYTDSYILIDHGPLGTKCARVGCMPSKVLIRVAKDYHRRRVLESEGLRGVDQLRVDIPSVLRHVRSLRDHFAGEMVAATKRRTGDRLVTGKAEIIGPNRLRVATREFETKSIVIATGARPMVPDLWKHFDDRIFTSGNIFDQEDLPKRIVVIGLGPIGLEFGQSLSRLGIEIIGFDTKDSIATITDPDINAESLRILRKEFPIHLGARVELEDRDSGLLVKQDDLEITVDAALVAVGIKPNLQSLGIENLGVSLDKHGMPSFDAHTMQIDDLPVFIAGDVDRCRPILHEALDEGFIAGRNSSSDEVKCYCRRTPLAIVFSDPKIAQVGWNYKQLKKSKRSFVVGKADFSQQSRAVLDMCNAGLVHLYVDAKNAEILGAELICPGGEHLAHQLALAVQQNLNIFDILQMPFYHPTIEEGLRTAIQHAAKQVSEKHKPPALSLCGNCPESPLC